MMVMPQMKNWVQFINSVKLSGEGYPIGKGLEILTHKEKKVDLGIFSLGRLD